MKLPSTSIFKLLFCCWLIGSATQGFAQKAKPGIPVDRRVQTQTPQDTIQRAEEPAPPADEMEEGEEEEFVKVKDTTNYPLLTEIQLFLDYGKLLTLPFDFERKFEGGAQVLFENRYLLSFSYGHGSIWPKNAYKNVNYNATGSYIKPGLFYQMTINPKNKISGGVQYGLASFDDMGHPTIESGSGLFEPYEREFSRTGLTANWWELGIQSESNWRGNFWLGFRLSFRKLIEYDNPGNPDVLVVPGYGRTNSNSVPAVNLYLKYKLSFYRPPVSAVLPTQ